MDLINQENGVITIHVIAAVIQRDGQFLLCQRPPHKRHGGLWEFPGGKLEAGESFLKAARRELAEELGVEVTAIEPISFSAADPGSQFVIDFLKVHIEGSPRCIEHAAIKWLSRAELLSVPLAPSDHRFVLHLQQEANNGEK